jgi:flagellar biosynthesis protein FlhA
MATAAVPRASHWLAGWQDLILPLAVVASVLVVLVPLPPAVLDVLLAANIGIAVLVLLTTIYVRTPLEFSVFPTLLLACTLARLVLNVATTRLVLSDAGSLGSGAAGAVVEGFGNFVAGDKLVVGFVIFAIIVVIQFVVITKGATRISGREISMNHRRRCAARKSRNRPSSSGRWTVPASSSAATPSQVS